MPWCRLMSGAHSRLRKRGTTSPAHAGAESKTGARRVQLFMSGDDHTAIPLPVAKT